MYANLGNIDTYITARYSVPADGELFDTSGALDGEAEPLSVDEKKKIFKKRRLSSRSGDTSFNRRQDVRGVMLFNREEVQSLFGDILDGLEFLVSDICTSRHAVYALLTSKFSAAFEGHRASRSEVPECSATSFRGRSDVSAL